MALRLLKDIRSSVGADRVGQSAFPKLRTDRPCFVVGDINGRLDLLDRLLDQVDDFVGAMGVRDPHLVFIGNYIGFGPDSIGVLSKLQSLAGLLSGNFHCLIGSHELMLLDFLENPCAHGKNWFEIGGLQVLDSFGVVGTDPSGDNGHLEDIGHELRLALNTQWHEILDWMVALPTSWQSGNMLVLGAGTRHATCAAPSSQVATQTAPLWIASGQKICDAVTLGQGRISLDTNAVQTGRLSAFVAIPGHAPVALQT